MNYAAAGRDGDVEKMMQRIYGLDFDDSTGSAENEDDEDLTPFEKRAKRMTPQEGINGLRKRILRRGLSTFGAPPPKATVTVHYTMFFENQDEPFDSSELRGRAERYKLDDGRFIPGFEAAVKSMEKDEEAEFLIAPELAFGVMGCPPRIPGNATVYARVKLVNFTAEDEAESLLAMDLEARAKANGYDAIEKVVRVEHVAGNNLYRDKDYRGAERRYFKAVKLLEDSPLADEAEELRQLRLLLKLRLNRSQCLIKLCWPKKACIELAKALEMDPKNTKALFRMGRAKKMIGNRPDAKKYLLRAQKEAPNDPDINHELWALDREIRRDERNERILCTRMFSGEGVEEDRDGKRPRDYVDDEFFEDMHLRLKALHEDDNEKEFLLPDSFSRNQIRAVEGLLLDFDGLLVLEMDSGTNTIKVVKKKD